MGAQGRLATAARGRLAMPSSMGRPGSGMAIQENQARPMTAVRAAGFTSAGNRGISGTLGFFLRGWEGSFFCFCFYICTLTN